jgi:hypothetical protein
MISTNENRPNDEEAQLGASTRMNWGNLVETKKRVLTTERKGEGTKNLGFHGIIPSSLLPAAARPFVTSKGTKEQQR